MKGRKVLEETMVWHFPTVGKKIIYRSKLKLKQDKNKEIHT